MLHAGRWEGRTGQTELEVGRRELWPEEAGADEHREALQVWLERLQLRRGRAVRMQKRLHVAAALLHAQT